MAASSIAATEFPATTGHTFSSTYDLHEQLGQGAFSTVRRCVHKATGTAFAVKVIDTRPLKLREAFDVNRLLRETNIMRRIDHPNIIKLHEVFREGDDLMLVMELGETRLTNKAHAATAATTNNGTEPPVCFRHSQPLAWSSSTPF